MAVGLVVFHESGKIPVPSLLTQTARIEPCKPQRLQPLPAIHRQLAAALKLALVSDPIVQASGGTLLRDFKMAVGLVELNKLVEMPLPALLLNMPVTIPVKAQRLQPLLAVRAQMIESFQQTLGAEPLIQAFVIALTRNLEMTLGPVKFNEPVKLPVPGPFRASDDVGGGSHGRLAHASLRASCSSKISCTVNSTMLLQLGWKNASASRRASSE